MIIWILMMRMILMRMMIMRMMMTMSMFMMMMTTRCNPAGLARYSSIVLYDRDGASVGNLRWAKSRIYGFKGDSI